MIAKLKGLIDTIGEDYCIIDVNGVGYLVFASAKTLGKLVLRRPSALLIETVVREDSISVSVSGSSITINSTVISLKSRAVNRNSISMKFDRRI